MENTSFPEHWLVRAAEAVKLGLPRVQLTATLPDVHVASSLLQKALRRADAAQAHRAGNFLLASDPGRLWRRLVAITFEDFGFSNLDATGEICAIASARTWRGKNGGDALVLSYALDRLLTLPRDRIVDSGYMIAIGQVNQSSSFLPTRLLVPSELALVMDQIAVVVRTCEQLILPRRFRVIVSRQCGLELDRQVSTGALTVALADVLRQGYRSSQCLLPVVLPLMSEVAAGRLSMQYVIPPVADVLGVPGYSLDGYTRLGRTALAILARKVPGLAKLLQPLNTPSARNKALTALLFAAEGGICTTELSDPSRDVLRAASIAAWTGMTLDETTAGVEAVKEAIPALNAIRQELAPEMAEPRQLELRYGE